MTCTSAGAGTVETSGLVFSLTKGMMCVMATNRTIQEIVDRINWLSLRAFIDKPSCSECHMQIARPGICLPCERDLAKIDQLTKPRMVRKELLQCQMKS